MGQPVRAPSTTAATLLAAAASSGRRGANHSANFYRNSALRQKYGPSRAAPKQPKRRHKRTSITGGMASAWHIRLVQRQRVSWSWRPRQRPAAPGSPAPWPGTTSAVRIASNRAGRASTSPAPHQGHRAPGTGQRWQQVGVKMLPRPAVRVRRGAAALEGPRHLILIWAGHRASNAPAPRQHPTIVLPSRRKARVSSRFAAPITNHSILLCRG